MPLARISFVTALFLLQAISAGIGAEVQVVLDGLHDPNGVAVQPATGDVFVSESGLGRVLRVVDGKAESVITGLGHNPRGDRPDGPLRSLGLAFLSERLLLVGGGDTPGAKDLLRVFEVPSRGAAAIQAEAAVTSLALPADSKGPAAGNAVSVAAMRGAAFAACQGDKTMGWIARATIKDGKLASLERFITTPPATDPRTPSAITLSPRGELVVGEENPQATRHDSELSFYHGPTGRLLLNLPLGLLNVTALTYGVNGQLYATDAAWAKPEQGGLFQLIARYAEGKQTVEAKRIVALERPTALACANDGKLYVTICGTNVAGSDAHAGKLLRVGW